MALIEGAGTPQTHYRAQQFCSAPHSWRSSASCPLSGHWHRLPPAISNIMEEVTCPSWERLFCSLPSYLPQREGWLPGGPRTLPERASPLFPYPRLGVGYPSCPDGWVPSLSGHHGPYSHVTHFHPSLSTQCPDEHLKSVLKGLCTYSLSPTPGAVL